MGKAKTTVEAKTASSPDGDWSNVGPKPSPTVSKRSPAKSGEPVISSANTTAFPTTLSVSVNPADGPPAWVTPADPSSATTIRRFRRHRRCLLRTRHLLRQTRCLHRSLSIQRLAFREIWWRHLNRVLKHFLIHCLFFYFVLK